LNAPVDGWTFVHVLGRDPVITGHVVRRRHRRAPGQRWRVEQCAIRKSTKEVGHQPTICR
jgi:hypothetical protein